TPAATPPPITMETNHPPSTAATTNPATPPPTPPTSGQRAPKHKRLGIYPEPLLFLSLCFCAKRVRLDGQSLAVPALRQYRRLQPLPQLFRKLIDLVASVNLNRLASRIQGNLAVLALPQM